jgi:CRISPR-associated protein Cmr6
MAPESVKEEMLSRREIFDELAPRACTNAGLWLDRFAKTLGGKDGKQQMLETVCGKNSLIRIPRPYVDYFLRRKQLLERPDVFVGTAEVRGRMVVGLGAESVLETSIALHRTYGVPFIPGSALKGLASGAAHRLFGGKDWQRGGESHKIMFGEKDNAGHVTFHDALFIPSPNNEETLPLDLDVMTVHHPEYYGAGKRPPTDFDSPIPVSFLTAHGKYLMAIDGPRKWIEAAWEILTLALSEEGIGAKTAAGYGRMTLDEPETVVIEKKARDAAAHDIATLKNTINPGNAEHLMAKHFAKLSDDLKRSVAKDLITKLSKKWLNARLDKQWVKDLFAAADEKI